MNGFEIASNFDLLLTDDRENRFGEDPIDIESAVDEGDRADTREASYALHSWNQSIAPVSKP